MTPDPLLDHIIRKIQERRKGERREPQAVTTPEMADQILTARDFTGTQHIEWSCGQKKYSWWDGPKTIIEFK